MDSYNDIWEDEFWNTMSQPQTATKTVQCQATDTMVTNEIHPSTESSLQHSTALLSPMWDDQVTQNTQRESSMSDYFASFNPASQCPSSQGYENNFVTQSAATTKIQQYGNLCQKMQKARITFVPNGNGVYKAVMKRKRKRTMFTTEQVATLEEVFQRKPYINRAERQVLVQKLQLADKSVKIWFQNRRLKHKREEDTPPESYLPDFDQLDYVESKIMERTDEFGYVTLDDKIMNDLVNIVDEFLSYSPSIAVRNNTSPIYEPISPASVDYSSEESVTRCHYSTMSDSVQELMDIESIIAS